MKVLNKLVEIFKDIISLPRNLANINQQLNSVVGLGRKLDLLNQRLIDLDKEFVPQKLDKLSQIDAIGINHKIKDLVDFELCQLTSKIQLTFENHYLQIESLLSIYNSLPNLKFLPPSRGWAGSPDFLAKIVELILKEKPLLVLEAGSGVSSVLIGLALNLNKYGESISLEHDNYYINITNSNMAVNGLDMKSTVKYCPIIEYPNIDKSWKWYDIQDLKLTNKIDMLIIDGPPRYTQELARYPAVPILHKYFADRFSILIDDSKREDEAIIIQMWLAFLHENNYKVDIENFINYEKGLTVLKVNRL